MRDDDQIARLLVQLRNAVAERTTKLNQPLEAEERAVATRVEQRKQLAQQLQLPKRLLTIYNEVQFYPHWTRNNPVDVSPLVVDVDVIQKEKGRSDKITTVKFSLKGPRYSFLLNESYSYETEGYYASLTLSGVNSEALFQLRMSKHVSDWKYETGETVGFVPGEWVLDFLELSESIATIDMERNRRHRLSEIERQKRDFGLGVSESEVQKLQETLGIHRIVEERTIGGVLGGWWRRLFS